jgi:hypothetical protein
LQKTKTETYENLKQYPEAEHQIGRLLNMRKILKIVGQRNLAGDIAEFGTWQGQGFRLLDWNNNFELNAIVKGLALIPAAFRSS